MKRRQTPRETNTLDSASPRKMKKLHEEIEHLREAKEERQESQGRQTGRESFLIKIGREIPRKGFCDISNLRMIQIPSYRLWVVRYFREWEA
jgi:hypothetical protein